MFRHLGTAFYKSFGEDFSILLGNIFTLGIMAGSLYSLIFGAFTISYNVISWIYILAFLIRFLYVLIYETFKIG
jgi:hypothetical protein